MAYSAFITYEWDSKSGPCALCYCQQLRTGRCDVATDYGVHYVPGGQRSSAPACDRQAPHQRSDATRRTSGDPRGCRPHQRPLVTNPSQNATRETEAPMKIHRGRPPDRPGGCPGRGPDLPSDPSQGEKHQASDQDLPSNHSLSTNCPASDHVSTAPNPFSLGAVATSWAPSPRVHCPAQPVGYICLPLRETPAQTCPLGHPMEPAVTHSVRVPRTR